MMSSSLPALLVDSAARSLLVAVVVSAGLFAFRTRNVVAQKAAWMLVLAAAIVMPWLVPLAARIPLLPKSATILVPRNSWLANPHVNASEPAAPITTSARVAAPHAVRPATITDDITPSASASSAGHFPAPSISSGAADPQSFSAAEPITRPARKLHLADVLLGLYLTGCFALLLRLAFGIASAIRLWREAVPVISDAIPETLRVRASESVASPITLGAGIVLPADFEEWDSEKLRLVLAHEASHVRQGDFWLQLCASLYTAAFWFSPLGWWIKRKLSDLSETISDRAAVDHAASHASYAQVLLEFAALPRPIPTGVAMASHGHVISRIERLLNESSFRQAFAGGRARIAAAVLLVPTALFAATALVRVEAAHTTAPQATAPVPPSAPDERTGTAVPPEPDTISNTAQAPTAPAAPHAAEAPALAPVAPETLGTPALAIAPPAPDSDVLVVRPWVYKANGKTYVSVKPDYAAAMGKQAQAFAVLAAQRGQLMALKAGAYGYGYSFGDRDSYAYVTGSGERSVHFSGDWGRGSKEQIEKARQVAHGDFLWFERDGKSYVIDDQAALAQLKPMQDKMEDLGKQQEALGKQQEELGRQQEALGRKQEQASVPTPDVSKELESLNAAIKKLTAQSGGSVTAEQLAEISSKLGDLQGRIGDIEGKIGEKQGELGEQQGRLGEQQGKLGEQQGRLGEQQGRIAREMDGKVLTIIDEYLKSGKAKQVQ
jgi:beta-lactamase regulating signal transducer with metallopeptidase domain/predicted  nucleic acid-binding Zn-ribbon protein